MYRLEIYTSTKVQTSKQIDSRIQVLVDGVMHPRLHHTNDPFILR